jgi:hypothetical protein
MKNVIYKPLIKPSKVLPPSLHIKLGLIKNFVKALDVKDPAFTYLCGKFPMLTFEKVQARVFIGPQIRQIFQDQQFKELSDKERAAWQSFENVSNGQYVAGNTLFFSHLNFFLLKCGNVSDEHVKLFHQDISVMEHLYKGKWSAAMLGDYCCGMKRDALETKYHGQARRTLR